jgi:carbamoyl-phosphate synthase large subunit
MTLKKIKVLVTGAGGAGTLGREIIKAFSMLDNEYEIIATNSNAIDLGVNNNLKTIQIPQAFSEQFIDKLLEICKKENIQAIAPGSEPETEVISKNYQLFSENNISVLTNHYELIKLCSDKLTLAKFLKSIGIKTPKTFSFNEIIENQIPTFPALIKPRSGSGSRNIFVGRDLDELLFFTNYLQKQNIEPIIQEYIPGSDNEYTVGILYSDDGKLKTSIAMRRDFHSGLSTRCIIKSNQNEPIVISSATSQGLFDDFPEIRAKSEKISAILKSNGPLNIQCRYYRDELYVFEINPRFSATTAARALVGCNEPDMFAKYKIFGKIPQKIQYKHGYVMKDFIEKFIPKK